MLSVDIEKQLGGFHLRAFFQVAGGVTGILGPSGCGKSMMLRCIAGIDKPDRGRITLDGVTLFDSEQGVNLPPQERKVGYLFQNYALFPGMTVRKNILCGLYREKDKGERERALEAAVALLRLEGLERHRPDQLSGGQQQRVALARILVNRPKLLLLDEPFSALDSNLRDQLQIHMKRLLEQYGGTVLLVTHSRDEAYRLCGRLALMDGGRLLALKETKTLFADPGTVAGASMTGCKNITAAVKTGAYQVDAPEWGVRLTTARPVGDDVCAVGVRAHYFDGAASQNRFPVIWTDELEEPFEWLIRFRYESQKEGEPDLWWRLPKEKKPLQPPAELGVSPADVLPLYPPPPGADPCSG